MPTPEEIENDRHTLSEVIRVKKENIIYWKSAGCGLDKPTALKSISIAELDLIKYQARLDALPAPVLPVASAAPETDAPVETDVAPPATEENTEG